MSDRRGSAVMARSVYATLSRPRRDGTIAPRPRREKPRRRRDERRPREEDGMDFELRGRTAVVTGCSVGIGREIARVLAWEGVATLVVARRGELLKTLQDEIEGAGWVRPHALAIDLADRSAAARVRGEAVWDESLAINFSAVRRLAQAFLPGMIERRWGRIVNITGTSEPAGTNAAGPAKAAVHAWAKGLSRDVGRHGITVNCLAPGRIHSEQIDQRLHPTRESQEQFARQIPLGYFGDPSDMAYLVD